MTLSSRQIGSPLRRDWLQTTQPRVLAADDPLCFSVAVCSHLERVILLKCVFYGHLIEAKIAACIGEVGFISETV